MKEKDLTVSLADKPVSQSAVRTTKRDSLQGDLNDEIAKKSVLDKQVAKTSLNVIEENNKQV